MKNKTQWHVILLISMMACKQSNELVLQPIAVQATVDLSKIKTGDVDLGRIANDDNSFDYLYIELYNTGQVYFENGLTASGVYSYNNIPAFLEFDVLQDEVYSLTMKTIGKGTGHGYADSVNVTNQLDYLNPIHFQHTNVLSKVYTSADSSHSTQQLNPELDIYFSQNNFSVSTASDTVGFDFNRMVFGVQVDILQCEEGVLTVVLNEHFHQTKLTLDYPTEDSAFKVLALQANYPAAHLADAFTPPPSDHIATKVYYQSHPGADTTVLFADNLEYYRLKSKRIEIDIPVISSPDTLSGNTSWINFSEQALIPGDTVIVD